jgi:glycosyltransferase involved in cell wall biosynthesis
MAPLEVMEVIVVDDGSTDDTSRVAWVEGEGLPELQVVQNGENLGKGFSVRKGLERASEPWVLVADADESTPWTEAVKLARRAQDVPEPSILIASRGCQGSQILTHQSFLRESLGRSFNLFVRVVTGLPFRDTQCGFKLVRKGSVAGLLPHLAIDGFAWDVELLLHAREAGVVMAEVPVVWEHKEDSRIELWRDGLGMVWNVLRVRLRLSGRALSFTARRRQRQPVDAHGRMTSRDERDATR